MKTDGSGFTVLHTFNGTDGKNGMDMILNGSTLYGVTRDGGPSGYGTVFKINTDGSGFSVLHTFTGPDGEYPRGNLVLRGAALYGTTNFWGTASGGTLFKLNTDGSGFKILHQFTTSSTDGNRPDGRLTLVGSTLYGATSFGGSSERGTVYSLVLPQAQMTSTPGNGSTLDFGRVLVGGSAARTVTATNAGETNSTLSLLFPTGGGTFRATSSTSLLPLDKGQLASQSYAYTPATRGSHTQVLSITSDAGNSAVTCLGLAVAPVQSIDLTAANAGFVRIGTIGGASFTVNNIGDGNLANATAGNLLGSVPAVAGIFSGTARPINLADNGAAKFSFAYAPGAHCSDSSTVVVRFDDGSADGTNHPENVSVGLSGTGVGPVYSSSLAPLSVLDFGQSSIGAPKTISLLIANTSTDPNGGNAALTDLTLLGASITGPDAAAFSISGFVPRSVLHAGSSSSLEISYLASGALGDQRASLSIITDQGAALAATGQTFTYSIQAVAVPEPPALLTMTFAAVCCGIGKWARRRQSAFAAAEPRPRVACLRAGGRG